jgi:transposase
LWQRYIGGWVGQILEPLPVKRRKRKLDWKALENDVKENPDARLIDRAKKFGVRPSAISYALKEMKITRKKKNFVTTRETENQE